ncbi:MAG: hypothetical protein WAV41_02155 [Microgenomates group bacterium]
MKKPILLCLILVSSFQFPVFNAPLAHAINPIIITNADKGAPPATNPLSEDSNYYPNDVSQICKDTYTISQTFDPQISGTTTDANGNTVNTYVTQDINRIESAPPAFNSGYWTNSAAFNQGAFSGSNFKGNASDPLSRNDALLSYNPFSDIGSLGASTRLIPDDIRTCLVGQRLVRAVKLASGSGDGSPVSNQQVAWQNGSKIISTVDSTDHSDWQKVQLDDIAITLKGNSKLFFDPSDDCYATDPTPKSGPLGKFTSPTSDSYQKISESDANSLYLTIGTIGNGPSRRDVCVYNDDHGQPVDPECKTTNMPQGEYLASASPNSIINYEGQNIPPVPVCQKSGTTLIQDKPNGLLYALKQALDNFGQVVDQTLTFSRSTTYEYHIDPNLQKNMSIDEVANKNLLPDYIITENGLDSSSRAFSSTDGYSIDPGNNATRQILTRQLLPESW